MMSQAFNFFSRNAIASVTVDTDAQSTAKIEAGAETAQSRMAEQSVHVNQ